MSFLRAISRFVFGVVFIVSGFLKVLDPIGFALKIKEYLNAFNLSFLDFSSIPAAIAISCTEFVIGVAILKGLKMKFFSKIALIFISFFTLLTLYSALFNPVEDCGCFGEAFTLSNWNTFFKNIVLFSLAILLYFQRYKFEPIASKFWETLYTFAYLLFALGLCAYSLFFLPPIDFGSFKAGTDLIENSRENVLKEYTSTLIYTKNGENKEFTLDNLPDTTWTFVEAKNILTSQDDLKTKPIDFILRNSNDEFVSEDIINEENLVFFISFYNVQSVNTKKIIDLYSKIEGNKAKLYILSGNSIEETNKAFGNNFILSWSSKIPILYSDYKTVLSFNRSNGGLSYISKGIIVGKWSDINYPNKVRKIVQEDPEILTANIIIREQLFIEICITLIFFMIFIVRIISKKIYLNSFLRKGN